MDTKIKDLKSEFDILDNPMDKYQHIIDLGKSKAEISENIRSDNNFKRF